MKIDAHFHIWRLARRDYGWLDASLKPIYRDVELEHWWQQASACGVQAGVLVQAAPSAAETEFLLQQASRFPHVSAVVGWVDLLAADAVKQIHALAARSLLKGLRPMLQDISRTDWITQPAVQPALAAMADCGLVLDALIQPRHLSAIAELARLHPKLCIVIDHGAKPAMQAADALPAMQAWQAGLQCLADHGDRVMCKLSGLWTEAPAGQACQYVRPWAQALLTIWGHKRVIWGSDWPVLELAGSYAQWHTWTLDLLSSLDDQAQQAIMGGNAARMYRL